LTTPINVPQGFGKTLTNPDESKQWLRSKLFKVEDQEFPHSLKDEQLFAFCFSSG
jgi:hypothetical protein